MRRETGIKGDTAATSHSTLHHIASCLAKRSRSEDEEEEGLAARRDVLPLLLCACKKQYISTRSVSHTSLRA